MALNVNVYVDKKLKLRPAYTFEMLILFFLIAICLEIRLSEKLQTESYNCA